MKILIAYDGTEGADIGIDELRYAGLPADVEALMMSVADVWVPPPARNEILDDTFPLQIPAGVKWSRKRAAQKLEAAQKFAERGGERVRRLFPRWTVSVDAVGGTPADEILKRAKEWQPQLIVVGSDDHTTLGKIALGSVSQKLLKDAKTSVRVVRRTTDNEASGREISARRIVIGVDGSPGSQAAVRAVAARDWSPGSEMRVVAAVDSLDANPAERVISLVKSFDGELHQDAQEQTEKTATAAAIEILRQAFEDKGISISSAIETDSPPDLLVRQAADFGADCIFTGASGVGNSLENFVLGSVSQAVAERASCSVEVVRGG